MITQPIGQLFEDYRAFAEGAFPPGDRVFYDGEMDPLYRWAAQEQEAIEAEIAAAGGLDAWRAVNPAPIKHTA